MSNKFDVIDVEFEEIKTVVKYQNLPNARHYPSPYLGLLFTIPLPIICAGAAFDLWSSNAAMMALIAMAAGGLICGLNLRQGPLSGVYVLAALAGLAGTGIVVTFPQFALAAMVVTGFSLVAIAALKQSGWTRW